MGPARPGDEAMEGTDDELMHRVGSGDAGALAELFERYHVALFRFCLRMTGNRPTSEDLVQDVFMRMLKHAGSFRRGTTFAPWMYRIARNACVDHLRRSARAPEQVEDLDGRSADEPAEDDRLSRRQQAGLIRRALLSLPVERREILLLSRYEFKSYDEIATVLGTTASNVKVRAHRAIRQLRQIYAELANEAVP